MSLGEMHHPCPSLEQEGFPELPLLESRGSLNPRSCLIICNSIIIMNEHSASGFVLAGSSF